MPRLRILEKQADTRAYSFTVVFEPVGRKGKRSGRASSGYQVTVPLLPGIITYGRTLSEAREMAKDAIRCHLKGLRKDGEPIPDERTSRKEKLRIALSA